MSNSRSPQGKDDCIQTPTDLADKIISHFRPYGRICDPCEGAGAFANIMNLPDEDRFEIQNGKDFLCATGHWDWIITNPPWGKRFRPILSKAMDVSDNIVFLCNLNVWFTKCRMRMIRESGFGIVEMLCVTTPPNLWPQEGFQLGATWLRRDWRGSLTLTELK